MTNIEFLTALFKDDLPFVHVTDFTHDPSNIPSDQHLIAWKGDWFSRYRMTPGSNQYFTISIFNPDDKGVARRRKALFLRTRVIVLDDVKEKLSMGAVSRLPQPSWILETSLGSEQWGYILVEPCHDRGRVENLLDGLVANGLAPDGRDPGMKGATRYVRLPEGYNTKASKMINGQPFKCVMKEWHPGRTTTLEALAAPFQVNLDAVRREARTDGAVDIPDHPLLQIPDIIHIKEVRSDGRFDITCPWVDEHTGEDDSGTAIFTNDDGSIGYKCHHGGCADRSARDLVNYVESQHPGFGSVLSTWRIKRVFEGVVSDNVLTPVSTPTFITPPEESRGVDDLIDALRRERHTTPEARTLASNILRFLEEIPTIERNHWHNEVCDLMHWTKLEFKSILKGLRSEWCGSSSADTTFLADMVFIKEQNRFYDYNTRIFYTPEALQNSYSDQDIEAKKTALQDGVVEKVDKIDFAPRQPRVFERDNIRYGNTWCARRMPQGVQGDCSRWLDHWDAMGWSEHRNHHLQWMAYTLKHPENKINHILILGGAEGTGKDFLLSPLIEGMGDYANIIDGNDLLSNHNEYLMSTKYLHVNETELGDHREAKAITNKLKPLAAAPPKKIKVNPKGITAMDISNIVNATMTTNSRLPLQLTSLSRRFHAVWTNLSIRDENEEMIPTWVEYWNDQWQWMENGGYDACIHYLLNEVDISQFNPGKAPVMTEFLRNIREASKSPAQQTVETFIRNRVGAFHSNLATAAEMSTTIRAAAMTYPDMLQMDAHWFTPTRIGRILGEVSGCAQMRGKNDDENVSIWVIRENEKYINMTQEEILNEYKEQIVMCKPVGSSTLQVAK